MKTILSEYKNDYKSYSFSYCKYAICENVKDLKEIYETGYLPYSGSKDLVNHFYLCRSLRVNLNIFKENSENRRVLKKFTNHKFYIKEFKTFSNVDKSLLADLKNMFLEYFRDFHGDFVMSPERMEFIFGHQFVNLIKIYFETNRPVGMVVFIDDSFENRHFWFSAYTNTYKKQGFGMYMMLGEIIEAKKCSYKNFYLGTGYGEKAKYKLNFDGLEFFDGNVWDNNLARLKKLLNQDVSGRDRDLLKEDSVLF